MDETRTHFDNGQVNTIANTNVGTATYAYDDNGNKLSESWSGAMSSWNFTTQSGGNDGYDAEDRFLNFNQSGQSKTLAMTRSNIGNISNVNLNGTGTARSYSDAHELTGVGASSQSFDSDGNLTGATNGNTFTWDEAGMMQQASVSGGPTVENGYGAAGKRIWKKVTDGSVTETVYVHAGPNCIAEYAKGAAPSSSGNEYVYAGAIDSLVMLLRSGGSQKLAITRNQQWSVSALVNASGSVVERYTYDHFGKRTILAANGSTVRTSSSYDMPYGYTSRRHDNETGLMYFRARYYDPSTGEFLSRDPLEYVDGMSLYRGYFVPKGTDPEGLRCQLKCRAPYEDTGEKKNGFPICFCKHCGSCFVETGQGIKNPAIKCPRAVCDGKLLNGPTNATHALCMLICEQNKLNPCNHCKRFPTKRLQQLCKEACKKLTGKVKAITCDAICCTGVPPGGLPGQNCLRHLYNDNGSKKNSAQAYNACEQCCNRTYDDPRENTELKQCKFRCQSVNGGF